MPACLARLLSQPTSRQGSALKGTPAGHPEDSGDVLPLDMHTVPDEHESRCMEVPNGPQPDTRHSERMEAPSTPSQCRNLAAAFLPPNSDSQSKSGEDALTHEYLRALSDKQSCSAGTATAKGQFAASSESSPASSDSVHSISDTQHLTDEGGGRSSLTMNSGAESGPRAEPR